MRVVVAALAALALVVVAPRVRAASPATEVLTLDAAFARVEAVHPELRVFVARRDVLVAESERDALPPPRTLGIELENVAGSGGARGRDAAELTLSLAGVLERGGKREARRALAAQRIDALAPAREARRLDLYAETARRYLAAAAARSQIDIADVVVAKRARAVDAARRRFAAGASPESVVLVAEAALARAELDRDRARERELAARRLLATMWGTREPAFAIDPLDDAAPLPPIADIATLDVLLDRTPELLQFAGDARVREARLRLARSDARADLQWSVGMRRREAEDDVSLVGSVTMPLDARDRAAPGIRAAAAELDALAIEREAKGASLRTTLAEAHGRYGVARLETTRYRDEIQPRLARAEAAAERAYRGGAISYLEWSQVQAERIAARHQQLDAAVDARGALIEMQRLTAEPLVTDAAIGNEGNTP